MPLLILSAEDAYKNASLAESSWPKKKDDQLSRLLPYAKPRFSPSFRIDRSQSIFTIGSCFARNIESQLISEGCNVASKYFEIPENQRDCSALTSILNRFFCYSILNEFRWALSPDHPFPDENIVELRPGRWFDMGNVHEITPSSKERVLFRRQKISEYMASAQNADVIVMTLGLAEAWFDNKTSNYINVAPHKSIRLSDPARYEFHLLDYLDIVRCLDEIHSVLTSFCKRDVKILITVSPVALGSSFAGRDALVANTYSKAVQRAAVECFVRKYENVDYFPSFESVTLSDRRLAWKEDQAHASDEIVRLNVLRMTQSYLVDARGDEEIEALDLAYAELESGKRLLEDGERDDARSAIGRAEILAPDEPIIRLRSAKLFHALGDYDAALLSAEAACAAPNPPQGAYFQLGQTAARLKDWQRAHSALLKALGLEPFRPGVLSLMGRVCEGLQKYGDAYDYIRRAREQVTPDSPQYVKFSNDLRRIDARAS